MDTKQKAELMLCAALERARAQGRDRAELVLRDGQLIVTAERSIKGTDALVATLTGEEIRHGVRYSRWFELTHRLQNILIAWEIIK